jgi:hypothetical protein
MFWLNFNTLFDSWRTLQANPFSLSVQTMVESTPPLILAISVPQRAFLENLLHHTRHKEMSLLRGEIALYLTSQGVLLEKSLPGHLWGRSGQSGRRHPQPSLNKTSPWQDTKWVIFE